MQEYTEKLESLIKDCSLLIESFIEIGLDTSDLKDFQDYGDLELRVLSQYPPSGLNKTSIPENLPTFCFPNGIEVVKNERPGPQCYSNMLTNEHGGLLYCSILKVFEEVLPTPRESLELIMEISDSSYLTPDLNKSFSSETSKTVDEVKSYRLSHEFKVLKKEFFMVPKALIIISTQPLFNTFAKLLQGLYQTSKKRLMMPVECFVSHMVTQIPLPPKGKTVIKYQLDTTQVNISLPPCNHLPVFDLNMGILFNCLDLDNILTLFRDVLLEKSTVFISSSEEKLSVCTNILTSLLFPFHWNMVFVPILPHTLLDYLYSPVTFIFGVHSKHLEEVYARVNDSVTIVDLDNNCFLVSSSQSFTRKSFKTSVLPRLPDHYSRKLRKRLINVLSKYPNYKGKPLKLVNPIIDDSNCLTIRNHFFQFFVSILIDYKKFMNFEANQGNSTFNNSQFIQNSSEKDFFTHFLETQMFSNFCQSRIQPKNIEEHCEGLLFDEEIIAKQNRSKFNPHKGQIVFKTDTSEDHKQVHVVPSIEEVFRVTEFSRYSSFPVLSLEVLARLPFPSTRPPRLSERLETSPALAPNWRSEDECVLTAWMDLWGLFLHCQHHSELPSRMEELKSVADKLQKKTNLNTISIYKHLLEICFNTQPSLALEIYSFMSSAHISADAETLQLLQKNVSKLYAKDQMILMQNTGTNMVITQADKQVKLEKKLKRIYTKPDDMKVFGMDQVAFLIKEVCKSCGKRLKVEDISAKWVRGPYKYESECAWCGEILMPKLQVKIGLDIAYFNRKSHAIREEYLFVSPFMLRQLVSDLIISNKELNLEQFRCGYPMIFWNCVWYFYSKALPFDFVLIYDEENYSELLVMTEVPKTLNVFNSDKSTQTEVDMQRFAIEEEKWKGFVSYIEKSAGFI